MIRFMFLWGFNVWIEQHGIGASLFCSGKYLNEKIPSLLGKDANKRIELDSIFSKVFLRASLVAYFAKISPNFVYFYPPKKSSK